MTFFLICRNQSDYCIGNTDLLSTHTPARTKKPNSIISNTHTKLFPSKQHPRANPKLKETPQTSHHIHHNGCHLQNHPIGTTSHSGSFTGTFDAVKEKNFRIFANPPSSGAYASRCLALKERFRDLLKAFPDFLAGGQGNGYTFPLTQDGREKKRRRNLIQRVKHP